MKEKIGKKLGKKMITMAMLALVFAMTFGRNMRLVMHLGKSKLKECYRK